ncbi:hypothetical protein DL765_005042 [Monosporascus sp. GIB2]|nr:hypothetical protein DL765_005042 [Monosporascus sp. GIB2]
MADPIGAASAIAGLISLSCKVLSEGYTFVASVHRAPQELRELLCEVAALDTVLYQFQSIADSGDGLETGSTLLQKLAKGGAIDECNESLLTVKRSVERCQQTKGHDGYLSTALTADMATTLNDVHRFSQEISAGVTELHNWTEKRDRVEERDALLQWLNPNSISVEDNLKEGLNRKHPGTCEWLFESDYFRRWITGQSSVLWIHGIRKLNSYQNQAVRSADGSLQDGSGKTVLASHVVSTLNSRAPDVSHGMIYFFCDHRDSNKRTLQQFFAAASMQLLCRYPDFIDEATSLFRHSGNDMKRTVTLQTYLNLFTTWIQKFSTFSVVIDALDECSEPSEFVKGLEYLVSLETVVVRILVTGRNDYSLQRLLGVLTTHYISLERNVGGDIKAFVTDEVNSRIQARRLKVRSHTLKDLIIDALSRGAQGILPKSLNSIYRHNLEQIKEQNPDNLSTILKALTWIVASPIPLTLAQLAEAISIDLGDTCRDADKIMTDDRDLLEMLGSLVAVDLTHGVPLVNLAHYTLYEFLQSEALRTDESLSMFHVSAGSAFQLGITCLQYLSFSDFNQPCSSPEQLEARIFAYPFLEFAALKWIALVGSCMNRVPEIRVILPEMDWLLGPCGVGRYNFLSWQEAYYNVVHDSDSGNDPLSFALQFQELELFEVLLQLGASPEAAYHKGYTPLHLAAVRGQGEYLIEILQRHAELEAPGPGGSTALHFAATYGHIDAVRILLNAGASPHARRNSGSTPFYLAARAGSVPILELLFEAGSDINAETWDGWTPIFEAIVSSHVAAVKWIVQRGAKLDREIDDGTSVLEFAQQIGNREIISVIEDGLANQE